MKLPARIGKYELESYLGGGMAEVYRARDLVLGRTVAVKVLSAQGAADPSTRDRFLLEAQVSSGISHENIITAHDYGEWEGAPFLVLEFLVGKSLKDLLATPEPLPIRERVKLALQLARALEHVHSLGMVHRDVKPDNIHVAANGRLKLMDFGIVKTAEVQLTQAGYALGTPHYVAPELVRGEAVSPSADIYSFGVVFYEMLTGRRAIQAETVERIFYQILHEPLPEGPLHEAGVPEALIELTRDLTAKEPANRTASMTAAARSLESWLAASGTGTIPAPEGGVSHRRRVRVPNWAIAGASVAALALTAFLGLSLLETGKADARIEDSLGEMVLIPAGPFAFGPEPRQVTLPAYYIDVTEVTNEDYEEFCRQTKRDLPPGFERGKPGYPVVNVSFDDAASYAKWANKRLPTAEEWEKAARGADLRPYPWGAEAHPHRANVLDNPDNSWKHLVSVEAFRHGRSPHAVLQMAGNVREWTAGRAAPSVTELRAVAGLYTPTATAEEPWYAVKGGSYEDSLAECAIPLADLVPGRARSADLGFRCVRDR